MRCVLFILMTHTWTRRTALSQQFLRAYGFFKVAHQENFFSQSTFIRIHLEKQERKHVGTILYMKGIYMKQSNANRDHIIKGLQAPDV